jgi:hypothetical protein
LTKLSFFYLSLSKHIHIANTKTKTNTIDFTNLIAHLTLLSSLSDLRLRINPLYAVVHRLAYLRLFASAKVFHFLGCGQQLHDLPFLFIVAVF